MTAPVSLAPHPLVNERPEGSVDTYLTGAALMLRHAFHRATNDAIVAFRPAVERAEAQKAGVSHEG